MQETLLQLVVVAAPAVMLYFTGWSYLYFYLDAFKVNMNELSFDVPAIFIYSYPPLHALWEFHGWAVIIIVLVAVALALTARALWLHGPAPPPWVLSSRGGRSIRFLWEQLGALPATAWTLALLLFLVFVLPFPIRSLTAWAASHAANHVWDGQTVELDATLKKERDPDSVDKRGWLSWLWSHPSGDTADPQQVQLIASYWACMREGELGLIFSAETHYYLLCRAKLDQDTGNVFEVKGEQGLISIRNVYRIKPK
jgi:hypothetical protein